ncbi:ABC transporter substrate-binding protein [Leptolyngbya sp. 15MV]|nr:ABC transporter substrate-binding protein [Leptolyngbya sp. 15MV]
MLAPCATPLHIAAAPIVERSGFTIIGNTYGSTQLRDRRVQSFFFLQPLPDTWGASLAAFLKSRNARRVAIATMQNPFTLEVRKNVIDNAGGAYQVVFDQQYPGDIRDMTTLVNGMKSATPDAICALSYPTDGDLFGATCREQGLSTATMVIMFGPNYPSFAQRLGSWSDGILSLGIWSRNVRWPGAREFHEGFTRKVGTPPDDKDAVVVYASAQVLGQALVRAGTDKAAVRAAVRQGGFETIIGPVSFGADNVNTARVDGLTQLQNGINELVWPEEARTAPFRPRASVS